MSQVVWGVIAGTLIVLLLMAIVFITFFLSNQKIERQEKILAETKLHFEKEIRGIETEVQEHLMASIANELHDNAGQLLTAMHIEIHNQKTDFPEQAENFKLMESYLEEVIQLLRLLGKSLNTDFIHDSGLKSALQVETERLNSLRRFQVHLNLSSLESKLQKDQELILFRIFQEIMQNALKHAKAKNVYVDLHFQPFSFTIKDDGVGFDYAYIKTSKKASGLRNIVKRANLANLTCQIDTQEGKGATFTFQS